jgi:hypothetical protein
LILSVCLPYEKSRAEKILALFWWVPLSSNVLKGEPVEEINMKIKKKPGPHQFMVWMNFRRKKPGVYKLLRNREELRKRSDFNLERPSIIKRKIQRIDLELERHSKSLKKAGFELEYHPTRGSISIVPLIS